MKEITGGAGEARTPALRFRKPSLYPSELQPHTFFIQDSRGLCTWTERAEQQMRNKEPKVNVVAHHLETGPLAAARSQNMVISQRAPKQFCCSSGTVTC